MVFYEAPHKLVNTLNDLYAYLGDREIAIVREITKLHEQVIRTTLSQAVDMYREDKPKGEFVLIVQGKKQEEQEITFEDAIQMAKEFVNQGESVNNAAKRVATLSGFKKSDIYRALI